MPTTVLDAPTGANLVSGSATGHTDLSRSRVTGHDERMDDYFDLGSHTRAVTTTSDEAQRWFDRGLAWSYAFNHEEAVRCFEHASTADPQCAMAYWGVAYALGPNYNKPWEAFDDDRDGRHRPSHPRRRRPRAESSWTPRLRSSGR